jgi:hypothetical protein
MVLLWSFSQLIRILVIIYYLKWMSTELCPGGIGHELAARQQQQQQQDLLIKIKTCAVAVERTTIDQDISFWLFCFFACCSSQAPVGSELLFLLLLLL